ncbi:MAG: M48 family metalloprotease [Candidatus Rokubacteria bacterium]|nr:M48 family metalloprotease [Candidatus Rokubacteria bacterium]
MTDRPRPVAVLLLGIATAIGVVACARATFTPIADWRRDLCVREAVAVHTPWDAGVHRVLHKLHSRSGPWSRQPLPAIVVVTGPPMTRPGHFADGWICGSTIVLHANAVADAARSADSDRMLATIIAHELAHLVLGHGTSARDPAQLEFEADALGAYFFEKGGFDCAWWVARSRSLVSRSHQYAARERGIIAARYDAVQSGCALAKSGGQVPVEPR